MCVVPVCTGNNTVTRLGVPLFCTGEDTLMVYDKLRRGTFDRGFYSFS